MLILKAFVMKYFLKFGIVGAINTIVQQSLYLILILLGIQFLIAQTLSFVIAFLCSYLLNSKFTYGVSLSWKQLFQFFLANVPAYLIQFAVLIIVVEGLGVPKSIALCLTLFITIPITFVLVSLSMSKGNREG